MGILQGTVRIKKIIPAWSLEVAGLSEVSDSSNSVVSVVPAWPWVWTLDPWEDFNGFHGICIIYICIYIYI